MLTLPSAMRMWSEILMPEGLSGCSQDTGLGIQTSWEEIRNASGA